MATHTLNFPGANLNAAEITVDTATIGNIIGGFTVGTNQLIVDGITGAVTASGSVTLTDTTSATSSTTGALKVAGGISTQENLNVAGDINLTGNVVGDLRVTRGLITNTGGVTKKTYSYTGTLTNTQTIADSTIKITFSNHVFRAKVVAHLVEGTGENLSTIAFDCAGGKWDGTTPSNNISKGPVSVIGASSSNPWNSTLTRTATTVAFAPTLNMAADGAYNVFIEYISQNSSGVVINVIEGSTTEITFGY
jgi:hypothetical protein